MNNKPTFESLEEISPFDIRTVFNKQIAERGKSITDSVDKMVLCTGSLIASVQGSEYEPYSTEVGLTEDGSVYSQCTCPYGTFCKHGAAMLYTFIKLKGHVPEVSEDVRFKLIENGVDRGDDDEFDEDWEDYDDEEVLAPTKIKSSPKEKVAPLEKWIEKHTKDSLKQLIVSIAEQFPIVSTHLNNLIRSESSGPNQLVGEIRRFMKSVERYDTGGYSGYSEWRGIDRNQTALAGIGRCISKLTALKAFTELFSMAKELFTFMNHYVENDHYNDCANLRLDVLVEPLVESVMKSGLTVVEKMYLLTQWEELDEYSVFDSITSTFGDSMSSEAWSEWADICMKELSSITDENRSGKAIEKIVVALEHAGREEEVVPFLQQNLDNQHISDLYLNKTELQEQFELFESHLIKLILSSANDRSWKSDKCRSRFAESRSKRNDFPAVFQICRDMFLTDPSEKNYNLLLKSSAQCNFKDSAKSWAVEYLETENHANCPDQRISPLPIPVSKASTFPQKNLLLRIALDDKNQERAIYWYDFKSPVNKDDLSYSNEFADLIADDFPNRAVSIWMKLAIDQIERTSNEGYEEGGKIIAKIRKFLIDLGRKGEWSEYYTKLYGEFKRKRNFIKILQMIEGVI